MNAWHGVHGWSVMIVVLPHPFQVADTHTGLLLYSSTSQHAWRYRCVLWMPLHTMGSSVCQRRDKERAVIESLKCSCVRGESVLKNKEETNIFCAHIV